MTIAKTSTASAADANPHVTIQLDSLRPGTRLRGPIYEDRSDREVLLLASGTLLTRNVLQLLASRGICSVRIQKSEMSRLSSPSVGGASAPIKSETEQRTAGGPFRVSAESFVHRVQRHGAAPYDLKQAASFLNDYRHSVVSMQKVFESLSLGDTTRASSLSCISSDSMTRIAQDIDLFVGMGLRPLGTGSLGRHSMQVAMVAMSTGTILGLKPNELTELGIGCLIHDLGMMRLGNSITDVKRRLTPLEFVEVTKHPAITYDLLQEIRDVPTGARMVAYQMHERCNGTGYPRKRMASQIHPLAKIAAVADVFAALVSDRPWRAALTPYRAMEQMILQTRQGLFDPAVVRGLLQTVSLFPIGSCVGTSDGRMGRILRSNREQFTKPVVELWKPGDEQLEIVDLSKCEQIEVTKSIAHSEMPADWAALRINSGDFWE